VQIWDCEMAGVFVVEPEVHRDERGEFWRSFCSDRLASVGIRLEVRQSNISVNPERHTLRGLHRQRSPSREAKVITVAAGAIHLVVADLREGSPTRFGSEAFEIESGDRRSVVVPAGCAAGFLTAVPDTVVHYQMGDRYRPELSEGFRYDDPVLGIQWPAEPEVISLRDRAFPMIEID